MVNIFSCGRMNTKVYFHEHSHTDTLIQSLTHTQTPTDKYECLYRRLGNIYYITSGQLYPNDG